MQDQSMPFEYLGRVQRHAFPALVKPAQGKLGCCHALGGNLFEQTACFIVLPGYTVALLAHPAKMEAGGPGVVSGRVGEPVHGVGPVSGDTLAMGMQTAQHRPGCAAHSDWSGSEYCGKVESHGCPHYLAWNDIEQTNTRVRHPYTNGICFTSCPLPQVPPPPARADSPETPAP